MFTAPQILKKYGYEEATYMPIGLWNLLRKHQLTQLDLSQALVQTGGPYKGKHISPPMLNLMLNWGTWPKTTPKAEIQGQIRTFLISRGVPEREITDDLWKPTKHMEAEMPEKPAKARDRGASPDPDRNASAHKDDITLPEAEMLTQATKQHFGLFRDPFLDDVQGPEDVFLDADRRYVREAMFQAAKHGGFIAVIGESGAGKSVLRRDLIDRIARNGLPITVVQPQTVDKTLLTAAHISDAIIGDVSVQSPKRTLEAKARQIRSLLTGSSRAGNSHVLLIEEAPDLAVSTLKYLKRFWEMEDGFKRLLGIILIGQPELKTKLDERANWEAREVIRRCEVCELRPLGTNLEAYLALKFRRVGSQAEDVLAKDAYDAIRDRLSQPIRGTNRVLSQLYPLVVNNCVKRGMNLAAEIGSRLVTAEVIRAI